MGETKRRRTTNVSQSLLPQADSGARRERVKRRFVILGAGRPLSGDQNTALRDGVGAGRVLDWVTQAVAFLEPDIHFVGGYRLEDIARHYPDFHSVVNPEWEETGAAVCAYLASGKVDYVDVFVNGEQVAQRRVRDKRWH